MLFRTFMHAFLHMYAITYESEKFISHESIRIFGASIKKQDYGTDITGVNRFI